MGPRNLRSGGMHNFHPVHPSTSAPQLTTDEEEDPTYIVMKSLNPVMKKDPQPAPKPVSSDEERPPTPPPRRIFSPLLPRPRRVPLLHMPEIPGGTLPARLTSPLTSLHRPPNVLPLNLLEKEIQTLRRQVSLAHRRRQRDLKFIMILSIFQILFLIILVMLYIVIKH
ncbi:Alto [Alphapolyomavirus quartipanos]|nr:Alto [Alphapolyomavirus quartipanos]QFM78315.1 Alto [Alphapolyomavirus quartipanos]